MGPELNPVSTDAVQPERTSVVVIGGGIIGAATALFLSMRGVPVALFEKGILAGEQSSRNWGWVRKMGRDPRELPLMIESQRIWRELAKLTGTDVGYHAAGIAYLCETEEEAARREAWLVHARHFQLDTRMISGSELDRVLPGLATPGLSALYTPSDARAEPQKAVPAIVAAARRYGAKVLVNCAVRSVETAGGRVQSVVTEHAETRCDAVVLAGGAWSSLFCANMGLRLPQLKVRASVARTAPIAAGPDCAVLGADFALRRRSDGGFTVTPGLVVTAELVPDSFRYFLDFLPLLRLESGAVRFAVGSRFLAELRVPRRWSATECTPFERERVLDPQPPERPQDMLTAGLLSRFPCLRDARVVQHWAGFIDVTPDAVPVLSPVEQLPGFFIATGFSGHGFGIGPGAGRLMADLVQGATPVVDPTAFRFARFSEEPRPQPTTGI
jgi:glycine/D-amino acid oxidase-like deaminating enzyme